MRLYSVEDAQGTKRASDQLGSDPLKQEETGSLGFCSVIPAIWGTCLKDAQQVTKGLLTAVPSGLLATYHILSLFS